MGLGIKDCEGAAGGGETAVAVVPDAEAIGNARVDVDSGMKRVAAGDVEDDRSCCLLMAAPSAPPSNAGIRAASMIG